MKKIELLAPAGDKQAFIGAINAGADAVYLSGKLFGARKYANNFTKEEIRDLVKYAHMRNVKVFVTINTLIFEHEIESLFSYADDLVSSNVDALIVQDLGVLHQFVKRYPDTEIHASTQMNAYNKEQVAYLKNSGVKRVVLARETSVHTIKEIKQHVDIDLEVFVHGALCVSYSGNCLFSSFNGGRSGNRGACAQPCRLSYDLIEDDNRVVKDNYLLSTKDLMTLDSLKDIIESGVSSLKIEGRMKRSEYVIATVRAYREAIDHIIEGKAFDIDKRLNELLSVFNRAYTKGYILNEQPYNITNLFRPNHLGIESGEVLDFKNGKTTIKLTNDVHLKDGFRIIGNKDIGGQIDKIIVENKPVKEAFKGDIITIDLPRKVEIGDKFNITQNYALENSLQLYLNENYSLIPLDGELIAYVDQPLEVYIKTPYSSYVTYQSDYIVEKANHPKQTAEVLRLQFDKLGDTPFFLRSFHVQTDGISFIPNKILNDLKRAVVEKLIQSLTNYKQPKIITGKDEKTQINITKNITVKVETKDQLDKVITYPVDHIFISEHVKYDGHDKRVKVFSNRIWHSKNDVVARDYGQLPAEFIDTTMNVTNSLTVNELHKQGVSIVPLSEELDNFQINDIMEGYQHRFGVRPNLELIIYNTPELMLLKYCPITKGLGIHKLNCNQCMKHHYALRNKDKDYPLLRDSGCTMKLLHHKKINKINDINMYENYGIHNFRVHFTTESANEVDSILKRVI